MAQTSNISGNPELLRAALEGLEVQRKRIDEQIQQLRSLVQPPGSRSRKASGAKPGSPGPRRVLSASARSRIAAAQKKRWAEFRKQRASTS